MTTTSLWKATAYKAGFPTLTMDLEADVAIIGGGITGISAARFLSQAGKRVVVLEAGEIGGSTTGDSTGNLYATVDSFLYRLVEKWDQATAAAVVASRQETVEMVEQTVNEFRLACGFARRPHYIFTTDPSQEPQLAREFKSLQEAGLKPVLVPAAPLPFPVGQALKLENQAQIQPLAYVRGLAAAISAEQCQIFEHSKAIEIDDDKVIVRSALGSVRAQQIIMATHTPKGFNILQTELGPYREYGLSAILQDNQYPEGIFWSMDRPGHSIRSFSRDGTSYLIVIGEKHKTGQHDEKIDYFTRLKEFTACRFKVENFVHCWSAQHYHAADELPYIGRTAGSRAVYVATGFGTDGLIYGSLAAQLISNEILGHPSRWPKLYSAKRFTPAKSAPDFMRENLNVAKQYAKDYLTKADTGTIEEIRPGDGKLVTLHHERLAVSRDEHGRLTALKRACTHLGCIVHWNRLEQSWDCPCHGSRFTAAGEVIEGPAIAGLATTDL